MMRNALLSFVLAGGLACVPAAAHACDLDLSAPQLVRFVGSDNEGYDSFSPLRFQAEFSVTVRNLEEETCSGLLALQSFDSDTVLTSGIGDRLPYEITVPGGVMNLVESAGSPVLNTNAVAVSLDGGRSEVVRLVMKIPPRQIVPAGNYSQPLALRFVDESDSTISAEQSLEVVATVRPSMSIFLFDNALAGRSSIAGDSKSYLLDFGKLEAGEQLSVSVLVQSNSPYSMQMLSENGGTLEHTLLGADERIPYDVTYAGHSVSMAGGSASLDGLAPTEVTGRNEPLSVRIGDVGLARAGTYRDVLTISIQAD